VAFSSSIRFSVGSGARPQSRTAAQPIYLWVAAGQKKAYAIADNKLSLNAGGDEELLGLELGELEVLGFDLDLIGFTEAERAASGRGDCSSGFGEQPPGHADAAYVVCLSDPATPKEQLLLAACRLMDRPIAIMPTTCVTVEEWVAATRIGSWSCNRRMTEQAPVWRVGHRPLSLSSVA
jgi:hypothetical protein